MQYLPKDKIMPSDDGRSSEEETVIPKFVYDIAELDVSKGIANNGSEQGCIEAMQVYAEMIDDIAAETENYRKNDDLENAVIKIHAMKSTSRIIGAAEIGELAQALESAGIDGQKEKVAENTDELLSRCRTLGAQLRPLCEDRDEDTEMNAERI